MVNIDHLAHRLFRPLISAARIMPLNLAIPQLRAGEKYPNAPVIAGRGRGCPAAFTR
jgi:hypothetical protein